MGRGVGGVGSGVGRTGSVGSAPEPKMPAEMPKPAKQQSDSVETPAQKHAAKGHAEGRIGDQSMHGSALQKGLGDKLDQAKPKSLADQKYDEVRAKRKEFDQAGKKLEEAKAEAGKAKKDLHSLDTIGGKIDDLRAKKNEAKARVDSQWQQRPGESDSQFERRKLEQESTKRFTGKTPDEADFQFYKEQLDAAKQKAYAGRDPLKGKIGDAKQDVKEARKEYLEKGKELKTTLKEYRPLEKKEQRETAKHKQEHADFLKGRADQVERKAPGPEKEWVAQQSSYTSKHKGKSVTHTRQEPAKLVTHHRTEAEKAERKAALKEASDLRSEASGLKQDAQRLETSRGVREEIKDLSKQLKKERKPH